MGITTLFKESKSKDKKQAIFNKKEFTKFVSNQFREISKKNLKIPVTLYHL